MADVTKKKEQAPNYNTILGGLLDHFKSTSFAETVVGFFKNGVIEEERKKRSSALAVAYDNITKLENEYKKIRPDHVSYNEDGSSARSEWSKNKLDERNKLRERIEKYDKAFGHAMGGDFKDLYELNSNFKDKGGAGKGNNGDAGSTSD